jgi:hypothetical protein
MEIRVALLRRSSFRKMMLFQFAAADRVFLNVFGGLLPLRSGRTHDMEPVGSMTRAGSWVRLGVALWCLILGAAVSVQGATLTVAQDGTGDFTSVVEALLAAVDGDSVIVLPGIYVEDGQNHRILANDLVLIGESDAPDAATIRDINVRFYRTRNVTVANLRFSQGSTTLHFSGTEMVARQCVVQESAVWFYGLVMADSGDCLIEDCMFVRNSDPTRQGSAIYSEAPITVRRCFFYDNDCRAVSVSRPSLIEDCVFVNNRASTGAAI